MLAANILINRSTLARFLAKLPDETPESVEALLDPNDHQNVPMAMKLLDRVISLRTKIKLDTLNASDKIAFVAIRLLAALWDAILEAFLNQNYSLSEQLAALSAFAHLAYALHVYHNSAFMSNQLYSDAQALVKSAFTCVAQQQCLDSSQPFYLYQLGSDRLEELFAEVRTQCHNCNCDMLQLCERLSISADMVEILNRNPIWDKCQRRRSWFREGGIDHVNPRYYLADLCVGLVDLGACWDTGRVAAERSLAEAGVPMDIFASLAEHGGDFMMPNGRAYPGSSTEPDRSVIAEIGALADSANPSDSSDAFDSAKSESLLTGEDVRNILGAAIDSRQGQQPLLADPAARLEPPVEIIEDASSEWILVPKADGSDPQPVHIEMLLRMWFNEEINSALSFDRVRRVRGHTKHGNTPSDTLSDNPFVSWLAHHVPGGAPLNTPANARCISDSNLAEEVESMLRIDDVALIPIRALDVIALGFIKVNRIDIAGQKVKEVTLDELGHAEAKVFVFGQVLRLQPEASPEADRISRRWLWTGDYVRFAPVSGKESDAEHGTKLHTWFAHLDTW